MCRKIVELLYKIYVVRENVRYGRIAAARDDDGQWTVEDGGWRVGSGRRTKDDGRRMIDDGR